MLRSFAAALLLLSCLACRPRSNSPSPAEPAATPSAATWQTASMLHSIFGSADAHWTPTPAATDAVPQQADGKHVFAASVLLDVGYIQSGIAKHMLLLASLPVKDPETCHACGGLLSVYIFRQTASGWKPEFSQPYALESGQWGKPPDSATLAKLGPDRFGFSIEQGGMAQGEIGDSFELYTPLQGKIVSVLNFLTLDKMPIDPEQTRYTKAETAYTFGPGVTADFYDVHLSTTGNTRSDAGRILSARKQQICKFDGEVYQCQTVSESHHHG